MLSGLSSRWIPAAAQMVNRLSAGPPLPWSADDAGLQRIAAALLVALLAGATVCVYRRLRGTNGQVASTHQRNRSTFQSNRSFR